LGLFEVHYADFRQSFQIFVVNFIASLLDGLVRLTSPSAMDIALYSQWATVDGRDKYTNQEILWLFQPGFEIHYNPPGPVQSLFKLFG
jgi:hypothetical protein